MVFPEARVYFPFHWKASYILRQYLIIRGLTHDASNFGSCSEMLSGDPYGKSRRRYLPRPFSEAFFYAFSIAWDSCQYWLTTPRLNAVRDRLAHAEHFQFSYSFFATGTITQIFVVPDV